MCVLDDERSLSLFCLNLEFPPVYSGDLEYFRAWDHIWRPAVYPLLPELGHELDVEIAHSAYDPEAPST